MAVNLGHEESLTSTLNNEGDEKIVRRKVIIYQVKQYGTVNNPFNLTEDMAFDAVGYKKLF